MNLNVSRPSILLCDRVISLARELSSLDDTAEMIKKLHEKQHNEKIEAVQCFRNNNPRNCQDITFEDENSASNICILPKS